MQLTNLKNLIPLFKSLNIPVHEAHSKKKSLISTYVRETNIEDLNHPVDHFGTEGRLDLVNSNVIWNSLNFHFLRWIKLIDFLLLLYICLYY